MNLTDFTLKWLYILSLYRNHLNEFLSRGKAFDTVLLPKIYSNSGGLTTQIDLKPVAWFGERWKR